MQERLARNNAYPGMASGGAGRPPGLIARGGDPSFVVSRSAMDLSEQDEVMVAEETAEIGEFAGAPVRMGAEEGLSVPSDPSEVSIKLARGGRTAHSPRGSRTGGLLGRRRGAENSKSLKKTTMPISAQRKVHQSTSRRRRKPRRGPEKRRERSGRGGRRSTKAG